PSPPIAAPSDQKASTKAVETDTAALETANETKSTGAKDTSTKSNGAVTDTGGEKKAAPQKDDPVKAAIQNLRTWSLPGFLRWIQLHAIPVVIILVVMTAILWIANLLHHRLVRL